SSPHCALNTTTPYGIRNSTTYHNVVYTPKLSRYLSPPETLGVRRDSTEQGMDGTSSSLRAVAHGRLNRPDAAQAIRGRARLSTDARRSRSAVREHHLGLDRLRQ